jgi:hypothetical protein
VGIEHTKCFQYPPTTWIRLKNNRPPGLSRYERGKEQYMPGFLLHFGATVLCSHGGQAVPAVTNPRVMVGGLPTVTLAAPYTVAGCTLPPPTAGNGPCVTAAFVSSAVRVTSGGQPLLLIDSQSVAVPTGTPLMIVSTQVRVKGT